MQTFFLKRKKFLPANKTSEIYFKMLFIFDGKLIVHFLIPFVQTVLNIVITVYLLLLVNVIYFTLKITMMLSVTDFNFNQIHI